MSTRVLENPVSKSLAAHLLLLMAAFLFLAKAPHPFSAAPPIEISLVEPKTQDKPVEKTDEQTKKMVVHKSEGQVVDTAKKDSYLSDKTRVVEKEQSARNSGEATVVPSAPKQASDTDSSKPKPAVNLSDLGVKIVPKAAKDFTKQRNWADSQTGETLQGGQYIHGMKEGEVSALNTKEYVFYSYFDRVRKQLDQAWRPILSENIQRIFKRGRKLASNSDFVTRTLVTLNQKGEIVKVTLIEESGTHDLDQAAIDALNKAGPYPNPPRGLIDASGLVQIRWDFVLKT